MITVLKNECYNHCHLWHSQFLFMLSKPVDSTNNRGKRECYGSFLVKKSKLNGKGVVLIAQNVRQVCGLQI